MDIEIYIDVRKMSIQLGLCSLVVRHRHNCCGDKLASLSGKWAFIVASFSVKLVCIEEISG